MRLSKALWADVSQTRPKRRRCARTGPCVPLKQRSDLLLSHPGLAVVTRLSLLGSPGPGLILAAGTRRTRSPRLHVHLQLFVLAKSWFAKETRARSEGRKLALARHNRTCRMLWDLTPEIRRDDRSPQNATLRKNLPDNGTQHIPELQRCQSRKRCRFFMQL